MTTWAQPIRHPWFDPPTMKRRLSTDDDDDDNDDASLPSDVSPATFSTRHRKRVRYDSLERTLAHMTLGNALATTSEGVDPWPKISRPLEQATQNVVLPSPVVEPGAAASGESDMEVEPTLVTNLPLPHNTHDWESSASGQLEIKEVQISSAVLDCLRRQPKHPPAPIPLFSQPSQALVLYRAPRPPSPLGQMHEGQVEKPTATPILVAYEDGVMEVE